jgi:hypothetical protein
MSLIELSAVLISLAGMYLTGHTSKAYQIFGYMLWLVSNAVWAYIGYTLGDVMMIVQFALFFVGSCIAIWRRRA